MLRHIFRDKFTSWLTSCHVWCPKNVAVYFQTPLANSHSRTSFVISPKNHLTLGNSGKSTDAGHTNQNTTPTCTSWDAFSGMVFPGTHFPWGIASAWRDSTFIYAIKIQLCYFHAHIPFSQPLASINS